MNLGLPQADQLLRRAARGPRAASSPTRCWTCTGGTRSPTSILLRGVEGFGARHRLRTDRSLTLSEDLPLVAVAVDTRARIEALAEPTARITGPGWSPWSGPGC